ncbi:apurinic/apyrimidinic endonuclease Apn1 [Cryptosporidium ryanae]|uniref:apurinic/apyrimidinic endonuclease Apn1 n=1 Tax=Cryptosporidium ryanae TaxID=515981 RepID=UPI00351A71BB|nr:apurinic/apyrimidinic endonuclease Apn1 [Cryptosporidium ryanae]
MVVTKKRPVKEFDEDKQKLKQLRLTSSNDHIKNEISIKENIESLVEKHRELALKYKKFVGAHVSASGGVDKCIRNIMSIAGVAFSMFLKPSRGWNAPPLKKDTIDLFKENSRKNNVDFERFCIPHGSYLINLGNPDSEKRSRMYDAFEDELKRCDSLGIKMYNFHPGSTVGQCSKEDSINYISDSINKAHQSTHSVMTVLENCAESKCVGYRFEELAKIIDKVENKERVGVCLDTCHLFAAGYDVRTSQSFKKVMEEFDKIIGYKYLKAMHINDSKGQFKSGLDRHENIGKGNIGMECFRFIMNSRIFNDIPLILETPDVHNDESVYRREISMLYNLIDDKCD